MVKIPSFGGNVEQLDLLYVDSGRVARFIYFGKLTVSTKTECVHTIIQKCYSQVYSPQNG